MKVRVRRMGPDDVEAVVALAATLTTAPHWSADVYLAAVNPGTTLRRVALVAEVDSQIAGFVVASVIAPQAELESIALAAEFQRQGIARRLFEALAGELAAAGASEILLEVRASNKAALGLYRALGFQQTDKRANYYANPVEDALLLRKPLLS